jgi:hypothetical protein
MREGLANVPRAPVSGPGARPAVLTATGGVLASEPCESQPCKLSTSGRDGVNNPRAAISVDPPV